MKKQKTNESWRKNDPNPWAGMGKGKDSLRQVTSIFRRKKIRTY